jgi:hypothetical protein
MFARRRIWLLCDLLGSWRTARWLRRRPTGSPERWRGDVKATAAPRPINAIALIIARSPTGVISTHLIPWYTHRPEPAANAQPPHASQPPWARDCAPSPQVPELRASSMLHGAGLQSLRPSVLMPHRPSSPRRSASRSRGLDLLGKGPRMARPEVAVFNAASFPGHASSRPSHSNWGWPFQFDSGLWVPASLRFPAFPWLRERRAPLRRSKAG